MADLAKTQAWIREHTTQEGTTDQAEWLLAMGYGRNIDEYASKDLGHLFLNIAKRGLDMEGMQLDFFVWEDDEEAEAEEAKADLVAWTKAFYGETEGYPDVNIGTGR